MLPLAMILREQGAKVYGSDRALDQGRLATKFEWITKMGIGLFPQDGSGLHSGEQILVASAAIEDSVPDIARANALGCRRMTRAELLASLFNVMPRSIAVGGTSGKSTVTGMIGWILTEAGLDPTIMNGAVMKNFAGDDTPFASSRVGNGGIIVSEVDESDGSIALFNAEIAVLNNVSLDHKSLEELRQLFGDFAGKAKVAVWNADDEETKALIHSLDLPNSISFGMAEEANYRLSDVQEAPLGSTFTLHVDGTDHAVKLLVPGRHNIANAMAAIAAAAAAGVRVEDCVKALAGFTGLARRFDIVGTKNEISVIDDFGHNPDKIAATLKTLKAFPGRVIAFFQPHGFGPIHKMGAELAETFATLLDEDDRVVLCDPVYFGGTVDRSVGSADLTNLIKMKGGMALYIPKRDDCAERIVDIAKKGDRVIIMGARDDSLRSFADGILQRL